MKLKAYTPDSVPVRGRGLRRGRPTINTSTTGLITISLDAADRIGLKDKQKQRVVILQDESEPENFYIEVVNAPSDGFQVRNDGSAKQFKFNSKGLVVSMNGGEKNTTYLLAGQPTEIGKRTLWGLIPKPSID